MEQTNKNRPPLGGGRMNVAEKPKNFVKGLSKLIKYCKPFLVVIIIAMIASLIASIFSLIGPDKLSQITDLITNGMASKIDLKAVFDISIFLACIYVAMLCLNYVQGFIMATVSQKLTKKMRTDISIKINRLPLGYFDKTTYGEVLSRVTNDVDTIGMTLNQSLPTLVSAVVMFFGAALMMFITNWIMALTALVTTFIGFILMITLIKCSQKYFIAQQKELGRLNGHIEEIYSGQNIVKVFNGEESAKISFNKYNKGLYNSGWKAQFMSGFMMPIMNFVGNLGYVAVCIVGALLAINNKISFGVIVAFMIYIRLFTQPLSQLAQVANSLQSTAAASERVFELLEEKEMDDEKDISIKLDNVVGEVKFEEVQFGYVPERTIINNFSINIKAGQKVAIVGPTGAGKTTIVNLLMRFYELNSGKIKIDGTPIDQLTRSNVHDLFCMVLQDTWIFEGTLKENIVYSKKGVTDEEVIEVCKKVGLHSYIKTLPQKYDTVLNDKASLSQGQKQLITIARAMVENAPLLILDEATSSVDTRTEILIQDAMDKLTQGRTSFVIAHRLSTIKNSDIILVMKDGDIIESGNHNDLIAKNGFYADLYNSQFDNARA